MSATSKIDEARIVTVTRELGESGFYFATSEDLEGLVLSAPSMRELDEKIPDVIARLYAASGVKVIVTWLGSPMVEHTKQCVALPAHVAERKLAEMAAL